MNKEQTPNYLPHDITPDGKFGVVDTGLPIGLQQEAIVYFPNGYTSSIQETHMVKGVENNEKK